MALLDKLLSAYLIQASQKLFNRLQKNQSIEDLAKGYFASHRSGAIWGILGMLGVKAPKQPPKDAAKWLESQLSELDLSLEITNPNVVKAVQAQADIAGLRYLSAIGLAGLTEKTANARAAGYAVRWAVQKGISDAAENSLVDDGESELLKTWVRLAARVEHRTWHDRLEGTTLKYSEKFVLNSPNGTFLIDRPYDPALPLKERIGCGHGIRVFPPRGSSVIPWDGGEKIRPSD